MLEDCKDLASKLDANERRISDINRQIRDLRLEEPNSEQEQALLAERKQLEAEITAADKRLYSMERIANQQRAKAENDLRQAWFPRQPSWTARTKLRQRTRS